MTRSKPSSTSSSRASNISPSAVNRASCGGCRPRRRARPLPHLAKRGLHGLFEPIDDAVDVTGLAVVRRCNDDVVATLAVDRAPGRIDAHAEPQAMVLDAL